MIAFITDVIFSRILKWNIRRKRHMIHAGSTHQRPQPLAAALTQLNMILQMDIQ